MDIDTKVEIAKKIHKKLTDVQKNEYNKWINYFKINNWEKALKLANFLSRSPMIRKLPQKNYEKIFKVFSEEKKKLKSIYDKNPSDFFEIMGYIGWYLTGIPIGFGMWKN
ncbi:MAG: hypothetical protein ACTSVV_09570 [Promethearchaeota archaeon]